MMSSDSARNDSSRMAGTMTVLGWTALSRNTSSKSRAWAAMALTMIAASRLSQPCPDQASGPGSATARMLRRVTGSAKPAAATAMVSAIARPISRRASAAPPSHSRTARHSRSMKRSVTALAASNLVDENLPAPGDDPTIDGDDGLADYPLQPELGMARAAEGDGVAHANMRGAVHLLVAAHAPGRGDLGIEPDGDLGRAVVAVAIPMPLEDVAPDRSLSAAFDG